MMRKLLALLLALFMLPALATADEKDIPWPGRTVKEYACDTLTYTINRFGEDGNRCYFTTVWMEDPGRQIVKATSDWHKNRIFPSDIAKRVKNGVLRVVINGSGYICKEYPQIPENYPGKGKDYFFEPLGSLVVNNGETMRLLEGVPYNGLTLQQDGIHLHINEDPHDVLAQGISNTWAFYDRCTLTVGDQSLVDTEWQFANERNIRTIIMKMDDHTYGILTVTRKTGKGLTMVACADFILEHIQPEWSYNLDGGPSAALLARGGNEKSLKTIYGNRELDVDIVGFIE